MEKVHLGNLSISDVYCNDKLHVKFLDCTFIAGSCENPFLAPEMKKYSALSKKE